MGRPACRRGPGPLWPWRRGRSLDAAAILSSASRQSVPILRALVSPGADPDPRARMIGPISPR